MRDELSLLSSAQGQGKGGGGGGGGEGHGKDKDGWPMHPAKPANALKDLRDIEDADGKKPWELCDADNQPMLVALGRLPGVFDTNAAHNEDGHSDPPFLSMDSPSLPPCVVFDHVTYCVKWIAEPERDGSRASIMSSTGGYQGITVKGEPIQPWKVKSVEMDASNSFPVAGGWVELTNSGWDCRFENPERVGLMTMLQQASGPGNGIKSDNQTSTLLARLEGAKYGRRALNPAKVQSPAGDVAVPKHLFNLDKPSTKAEQDAVKKQERKGQKGVMQLINAAHTKRVAHEATDEAFGLNRSGLKTKKMFKDPGWGLD